MLEFSISGQKLSRLDPTVVVGGSENYLACSFTFSEDWEGISAVAAFGHSKVAEPILVPVENGVCQVPHEVIQPYGFQLAVYGSGPAADGLFTHIPTDVATVEVEENGEARGLSSPEPTPSLYDSLMKKLKESEDAAVAAKVSAEGSAQAAATAAQEAQQAKAEAESKAGEAGDSALAAAASVQSVQTASAEAAQAAQAAKTAQDATQAAQAAVETFQATLAEREAEQQKLIALQRSYTVGTEAHERIASGSRLFLYPGESMNVDLSLQQLHRYIVIIDSTSYHYDELALPVPDSQQPAALASGEDITPEVPPVVDVEQPTNPDEPITTPKTLQLQVGDGVKSLTFVGVEGQPGCVLTNHGRDFLDSFEVYTDGHENSYYYRRECQDFRNQCMRYQMDNQRMYDEVKTMYNEWKAAAAT